MTEETGNRTVLITGASSGFGRDTALLFASRGWNVVATMRNPADAGELTEHERVLVTRLDVQDVASIEQAVTAGIARFGRIDVLINNAGFGLFGLFEATSRDKIREQFDVNLFGLMDVTRAVLPHFRSNKRGLVINISSGAGIFGLPMISLYNASKFALEGFSESLSYELLSQNIVVKIIEPGGVTSTGFSQRSASEAEATPVLADYAPFFAATMRLFDTLRGQRLASSREVAEVIFTAATDGSRQLRYVATKDIEPLVQMRRETSEAQYMAMMRSRFLVDTEADTEKA